MDDYERGFFAFYCGHPRSSNPFDRRAENLGYIRWETGWLDAYDIHQEALEECHTAYQVSEQGEQDA